MNLSDYLRTVVSPLLNHPKALKVVETQDQMGVLLTVDVDKEDMGIIIGKKGETAKMIRYLARVVGMKNKAHVSVKVNEPEGSAYKRNV